MVEIRDGLTAGAQVIAVKMEGLKAGAKAIIKTDSSDVGASSPAPAAKMNKWELLKTVASG
jgi:hypothetical protein